MKKNNQFNRNPRSHGAQYKITIPKFDFKQAAIEEKMVDEVLQGEYDNMNSPYKKREIKKDKNNRYNGKKLQPIVKSQQQGEDMIRNEHNNEGVTQSVMAKLEQNESLNRSQISNSQINNSQINNSQISVPKVSKLQQQCKDLLSSNGQKVYGYEQNDILQPVGDQEFLFQSLESTKDLINYDCYDEDMNGQQWVDKYKDIKGVHGKSPMYFRNKYQWVDVQVVGYNQDTQRFKIKSMNGVEKEVNRLSLMFKDENMDKFRSRLTLCKMRQQLAEDDGRFLKYVKSIMDDKVSDLSIDVKKVILNKALKRKQPDTMNMALQETVTDLIGQIQYEYKLFMKKVIVLREMQDNSQNQKFKKLRINLRNQSTNIPMVGTIQVHKHHDYLYGDMHEQIAKLHISSKQKVVDALDVFTSRSQKFESFNLFKTILNNQQLPMEIGVFDKHQNNHHINSRQQLHNQWRDFIKSEIQEILSGTFNFFIMDQKKYIDSELNKFLKRNDFMFNTYIRNNVVKNNIDNWCDFIKKFTIPDYESNDIWMINDYPLLQLNLIVNTKLQDKQKFMKKKLKSKSKSPEENTKMMAEMQQYENIPDEILYFEPNYEKVLEILQKPLQNLIETTNSFYNVENGLLPLLDIAEKQTYLIDEDQEQIREGIEKIKKYVDNGFEQAFEIREQFKKYQFLFERNSKDLLKTLFGGEKENKIIIEDLDRDVVANGLYEILQAKQNISKLCVDEFKGRFFKVMTQKAKELLIQKADEQLKDVLDKLQDITVNNVDLICKTYEEMQQKITMQPKDEHDLITLKSFISDNDLNLARLDKKVVKVSQFLDIMEDQCYPYDTKNLESFWFLKMMPNDIKMEVIEGQKIASLYDTKFREALKNEQETFYKDLILLKDNVELSKKYNDFDKIKESAEKINQLKEKIESAQNKVKSFNEREQLFKMDVSEYNDLTSLVSSFEPFWKLWDLAQDFEFEHQDWHNGPFLRLNFGTIEKKVNNSYIDSVKLIKMFEESEEKEAEEIARKLKEKITEFKQDIWVIELLTTEAMTKKMSYWKDVFKSCNIEDIEQANEDMTLKLLIEKNIRDYRPQVEEQSKKADKQWGIEKKLNDIIDKLKEVQLDINGYKDTFALRGVDDLQQLLDDQLNILVMMKASPYIKPVQKKAHDCENRLVMMQDTLEGWIKCQRSWMYLEPIFSSEDIKKKMQMEKNKFDQVDKNWRQTMDQFSKEPGIYEHMESDKLKNEFDQNNRSLEQIQKSLSEYLETKRKYFSRFFFLSDDQLLEILAQTKDPTTVQRHINKCFEAINSIEFAPSNVDVIAMISPEDEYVKFHSAVNVEEGDKKGNVEVWLLELEEMMRKTLGNILKKSMIQYQQIERTVWVLKWQAQIILAVIMIKWTTETEEAIINMKNDSQSVISHYQFLDNQLQDIVKLVRGELKELDRMTLGSMIVIDVHARDIIKQNLIPNNVNNTADFGWISQLRAYYDEPTKGPMKDKICVKVQIINATQYYGFEYLGNTTRLVVTPLTDRCYTTLMGAYHLFYGGAPEGPAGTGKTETTKDLAKAVAMYCVVFNCSDGLNYRAMSKFFKGLITSGAWCCFDEFNRINVEVLSVIAQQVIQIQNAIKIKVKSFAFDDDPDISLVATCTINITMNPGYAGRAELPDNLKALFRPCAMMVPNYAMISQIYLYSVGFKNAIKLATKIKTSLQLASEQLSSQFHYDFGMRAIKAILVAAGDYKREMADVDEDIVCLRALQDVNIPKFTINDIPLFVSITSDLFPGVEMPERDYGTLKSSLEQACNESLLIPTDSFILKCIQLYDTIMVRHGLMLVGESYSGKSCVINTLSKALNIMAKQGNSNPAKSFKLNPKSITGFQLYGLFDPDTKSWTDGVLPIIMRECAEDGKNPERKWVVFDGPVDAVWIENMNTVLDDNKKLCLTTGEIIKLSKWMTMVFEVEDLNYASPATVSRCGMVYLESIQLGWKPVIQSFFLTDKFPQILQPHQQYIMDSMISVIDPTLNFIQKYGKFPMTISMNSTVETFLEYFASFLEPYFQEDSKLPKDIEDYINNFVFFSAVWSIGAVLEEISRPKFHNFIMKMVKGENVVQEYNFDLTYSTEYQPKQWNLKMNDVSNIYDSFYSVKSNTWIHWMQTVPTYTINKDSQYFELLIPTSDNVRMNYFLHLNVERRQHVLFTGPTGTGKTANCVKELNMFYQNSTYTNLVTAFSGQTNANQVQKTIESKMTRKRKGVLGPEDRKACLVIFIDDLNMPLKEEYKAQPPIEILRQWQDHQGWYDLETKEFKKLEDIVFVGAMGPPSQGRNTITMRYSRHYNIMYVGPFEGESLMRIFDNIMEWYFMNQSGNLSKSVTNLKEKVIQGTIELYNVIKDKFLPTPSKQHYVYNMRDVSKVFQGISKATYKTLRDEDEFVRLWSHECMRVFQDRLINKDDQEIFSTQIKIIIKEKFNKDWSDLVKQEPLMWASYVPSVYPGNDKTKRPLSDVYCELVDLDKTKSVTYEKLEEFNQFYPSRKMNLVLFMNAIQHVIRIVRIITTPFGHAMLVGVGGSGRKSLAILSCFVASFDLQQVDAKNWEEELQRVMKIAGLEMKQTVFLFSDAQVWKESMLEDICNILNNGEVPNLFPLEEKMKIIEEIQQYLPKDQSATPNQKYAFFVSKCKENLHLVLCMSPEGEEFRKRIQTFPGLVSCTTIDWFLPWPEEALRSTAASAVSKITQIAESNRNGVVNVCADMQNRIFQMSNRMIAELRRYFYVTPTSYLELLTTITKLVNSRDKNIEDLINRYESGLDKLAKTELEVDVMKKNLQDLQPQLEVKSKENAIMLVDLQKKQKEADQKKAVCLEDEKATNEIRQKAQNMSESCQADLDRVMPLLDNAAQALEKITDNDINQIKSFNIPPKNLNLVLEGVCVALQHDKNVKWEPKEKGSFEKIQNFWIYSKKNILNMKLKKTIQDIKEEQIMSLPQKSIDKLAELLKNELLEDKALKSASTPGFNLCCWLKAVVETYGALLVVEPKKKELAVAQTNLADAEALLAEKQAALKQVLDILAKLQSDYDTAKNEKDTLEAQVKKCELQLNRAEKLINGLGGEKENWKKRAIQYRQERKNIVGDVVLSSGIIAYLGAFPADYREEAISKWFALLQENGILVSQDYSLQNIMTDLVTIGKWTNNEKLPNDAFSIDNAIILKNSRRWPLMIDPQLQANNWIKIMEKQNDLVRLKPSMSANFLQSKLKNAQDLEFPVLLENVSEQIDQVFEPILSYIGQETNFRFYMTTKLASPKYTPEVCVQVTLLNFMTTQQGLEDQLLSLLVRLEEPNKFMQREQNIKDFFENKRKQKQTEDTILKLLYESQGNILDDEVLINTLQQSQVDSIEIEAKLRQQEDDKTKFNDLRARYKNAAIRGSHLYFVVSNMANVEPVYEFSLETYVGFFEKSIQKAEPNKEKKEIRVSNIRDKFTQILYEQIIRCLLEKDKLLFSFLMTIKLMQEERKTVNNQEVRFFTVGGTAIDSEYEKPEGEWSTDRQWSCICQLADSLDPFKNLQNNMMKYPLEWKKLLESPNPHLEEEVEWPKDYQGLNKFQKLIIIRILRTEKVVPTIQQLVIHELGQSFVEIPPFNLEVTYNDSTQFTPLIFILSSGADPRGEIESLANNLQMQNNLISMSLGQGQGEMAERRIRESQKEGKWILLQNCHLAPSFMPQLEKLFESTPSDCHPNYRLWLTTIPSPVFPVSILQNGLKITYEPPKGLKNNLQRSYLQFDNKKFEDCTKIYEWKKMLFGLCFFHGLVLERRKFGPLGWNIPYEFSAADLAISISQLKMFLDEYDEIPWNALNYMVAECNYGGRVTDDRDRRLIKIILLDFYTPDILRDDYKFSPKGIYYAPEEGPLDDYREYIKNLPLNDLPEVFGLHDNAEISGAIFDTNNLCETILSILPRETGSSGVSQEDIMKEKCRSILNRLPQLMDVDRAVKLRPVCWDQSMNTVLQQEILRFNNLLAVVRNSISNILKAIDGIVSMSPELEEVYIKIFNNKISELWSKFSYPSLKPLASYIQDFIQRLEFIGKWIEDGAPPSIWIAGFYFTQSFLTGNYEISIQIGNLQNYARKYKIPIDKLEFDYNMLPEGDTSIDLNKAPEDGSYVYGLFLDGARWDNDNMAINEQHPKQLYSNMPYIHLVPKLMDENNEQEEVIFNNILQRYDCPVYKTSVRKGTLSTTGHSTNFVMMIKCPIINEQVQARHWVKRGVAILTQLND